jgi:hypothetical protein
LESVCGAGRAENEERLVDAYVPGRSWYCGDDEDDAADDDAAAADEYGKDSDPVALNTVVRVSVGGSTRIGPYGTERSGGEVVEVAYSAAWCWCGR